MIGVTVQYTGVEGLGRREANNAVKAAMADLGSHWHEKYLPLHFGTNAARRYDYTPRSGDRLPRGSRAFRRSYVGRKIRLLGHNRPLEYKGVGKAEALGAEKIVSTVNKVVIRLPKKFNLRAAGSKVMMADEIRAVRPDELKVLQRYLVDRVEERLAGEIVDKFSPAGLGDRRRGVKVTRLRRTKRSPRASVNLGAA